jgi:hypothetical protein
MGSRVLNIGDVAYSIEQSEGHHAPIQSKQ